MTDLFANLALGADVALSWSALLYCLLGVTLGMIVGVLPGVGPLPAIAMLLPITFYIDPTEAIIMLAGIYYGGQYGASTASILLNLPGTPPAAVTCLDGYPMAKQGRAGQALFMTAIASLIGSLFGIVLVAAFAPVLARFALEFGAAEYFSLILFALLGSAAIGGDSFFRSISMVIVGLILGIVGQDVTSGQFRFVFGIPGIADGLSIVAVAMGIFGVAEVMATAHQKRDMKPESFRFRKMLPSRDELRRSWPAIGRGSGVGAICGTLPGAGASMAVFIAYALEKRVSRRPEAFGQGAIEGVTAPESANNATAQTAFIPTLTLGVPGDAVMAVMIGALMIHGINPGPGLVSEQPQMFWGLVVSFVIGNAILVILNIPLVGIWTRLLQIPYSTLYPIILVLVCIGVYSINSSVFDIFLVILFGIVGYGMKLLRFPPAPLLLGFILSPMMEENFRRALLLSRGDWSTFVTRPISATFVGLSVAVLLFSAGQVLLKLRRRDWARHRGAPEG
ncbi:tripartite tricarboxylate transporter permease [Psychromarinibacter sp. C21-152]|uniref:Tripartite tricarboxylate transporter permease n=1 Tax=Psychromarinibacter sediminicola TaxID=3033385 RepID=A0AAE3NS83_9RHOB|nr:tripartite tricarboxylate transporter permease [Psychromarinibacter sediminicola]MDF0601106.1 tripartite tricarboxylate transporter permease [Psychromarinibacter sediminicola]